MTKPTKARRGFAAMSKETRTEIARKGGKSVNPENRSFSRDPELAQRAGKKGGTNLHANKRRGELTWP